jgi:hypothetical protein
LINYVIYDSSSGEIVGSGVCADVDYVENQKIMSMAVGIGTGETHYVNVESGELIEYTTNQKNKKNDKPLYAQGWSNFAMEWIVLGDDQILESAKLSKWEIIKQHRNSAEVSPLLYNENLFDADFLSQQRISGAVQLASLAPSDWTIDWTLADNSTITLSRADVFGLGIALGQRTNDIYAYSRIVRDLIDGAHSIEQLNEIQWLFV